MTLTTWMKADDPLAAADQPIHLQRNPCREKSAGIPAGFSMEDLYFQNRYSGEKDFYRWETERSTYIWL